MHIFIGFYICKERRQKYDPKMRVIGMKDVLPLLQDTKIYDSAEQKLYWYNIAQWILTTYIYYEAKIQFKIQSTYFENQKVNLQVTEI